MDKTSNKSKAWRKIFGLMAFLASLSLVMAVVLGFALYGFFRSDIPKVMAVKDYRPGLKSQVFAQNGELIAEFGVFTRIVVPKSQLPAQVAQAFIASEDKHFYEHHGIDFLGIINSVWQSVRGHRSSLRGASTITQQLAKGLLIEQDGFEKATARTISRKIKEAILARRLEMHLAKEDILWMYLNEVYLGHGSYGVAAAALNYFKKELKDLSIGQLAMIAGLPQAPSRFSPQVNMSAAIARQTYVLGRMVEDGYISAQEKAQALRENKNLEVFARENSFRTQAPYFSEHIRRELMEKYGETVLYTQGLKIYTTVDIERERAMQKVLKNGLIDIDKRQGFLGPIFQPKTENEQEKAFLTMRDINQKNLFQQGENFFLAQVERVDAEINALFIDTGEKKGAIPLSEMYWARAREPKNNYQSYLLSQVGSILKSGDIILVKERSLNEMANRAQTSGFQDSFNLFVGSLSGAAIPLFSLEQEPTIEGAMIALEPQTGYINAMSGGYSFDKSEFNRIYQACRQPGSAFKPVVYSAAIALKHYTPATMVLDAPLTFRGDSENTWKPQNLGQKYAGEVTVHEAVMRSMNVPTINVMSDVGTKNVLEWASRLGIKTPLKSELGTAIGSSCITPWELMRVFSMIANLGEDIKPILVKEVVDRDEKRLSFEASAIDPWIQRGDRFGLAVAQFYAPKNMVMEKEDAYTMHYLLNEAAHEGTGQRTNVLGRTIAGKTGTTNDSYDTWFAGYAKNLLSIVWVGNDKMDEPLGVYEQGGRTAVPLFNNFFAAALKGVPDQGWTLPESMCEARIDARSGLRIDTPHPLSFLAPFRCDQVPMLAADAPGQNLEQAQEMMGSF